MGKQYRSGMILGKKMGRIWASNSCRREIGLSSGATAASATREGQWWFRRTISHQAQRIIDEVKKIPAPNSTKGNDQVNWRHGPGVYKHTFSSSTTWNQIRSIQPPLPWTKLVWFSQAIPRQSFIAWLGFRDRVPTGQRMTAWGVYQPCVLCGETLESRDHLFFACPYSFTLWLASIGDLTGSFLTPDWNEKIHLLTTKRFEKILFILIRLIFQIVMYAIWRERNSRLHNGPHRSAKTIYKDVDRLIRNRISSLEYYKNPKYYDLLQLWFRVSSNSHVHFVL